MEEETPSQFLTLTLERKIGDLPPELIQEILSRLPIDSLFESRLVSHQWRNLTNNRRFAMMHYIQLIRNQPQQSHSLLSGSSSSFCYIPDLNTRDKVIVFGHKNLPFECFLPYFSIIGSVNGFICLEDYTLDYRSTKHKEKPRYVVICNPVTGDWLKLPEGPEMGDGSHIFFGFGYCPNSYQYKVVRMGIDGNSGNSVVDIVTVGDDAWRNIGTVTTIASKVVNAVDRGHLDVERYGFFVSGYIHWLLPYNAHMPVGIRAFDVEDEKFVMVPFPDSIEDTKIRGLLYLGLLTLGLLGGCLMLVDNSQLGVQQVWRMKEYGVKGSWALEYIIPIILINEIYPKFLHPLGLQKNGIILATCYGGLYFYDTKNGIVENLEVSVYHNFVLHVGTFVSLADVIARSKQPSPSH